MAVKTIWKKHRKLIISVFILLALWSVSTVQNKMAVIGAPGPETVSIVKSSISGNNVPGDAEIESMVRDAVAKAGGLGGVVKPGDFVVIKPNLVGTSYASGSGVVTHKTVVRTVVKMALEAGAARVVIAEGSAAYTNSSEGNDRFFTRKAFKDSGLDANGDMKDDVTGVDLYDMNITYDPTKAGGLNIADPAYVTLVNLQDGLLQRTFYQPNLVLKKTDATPLGSDVFISVPVFKNHGQATVTGGMKNRVGCSPCDLYHYTGLLCYKHGLVHGYVANQEVATVNKAIVDLNRARPADFTVMDALVGITNGPTGAGNPVTRPDPYVKCILAGRNATAVDVIETLIMGYKTTCVNYLNNCANIGFGQTNPAYITVVGKSVQEVRNLFPMYGDSGARSIRIDQINPTVTGITPSSGSTVNGTVDVNLSGVSDNGIIIKAELYVDDVLYAVNTTDPFSFAWDTNEFAPGQHTLKAKVYDEDLNEASITSTVTVDGTWAVPVTATTDGFDDTMTFGCSPAASDGLDPMDLTETFPSTFVSLASLEDTGLYSQDIKTKHTGTGDTREWKINLASNTSITSPITLSWVGAILGQVPSSIDLQLVDYGNSWGSPVGTYNMRDISYIDLPAGGPGVMRFLKIVANYTTLSATAAAKRLPDGEQVKLTGKIVTIGNDQLANTLYISDTNGVSGIKVASASAGDLPTIKSGSMVDVQGILSTVDGERVITSPGVWVLSTGNTLPKARSMGNKAVGGQSLNENLPSPVGGTGLYNVGSVVRIWGQVTFSDNSRFHYFYIDDGSNRSDGTLGTTGIRVLAGGRTSGFLTTPAVGSYVMVTGAVGMTTGNIPVIRPGSQSDIQIK